MYGRKYMGIERATFLIDAGGGQGVAQGEGAGPRRRGARRRTRAVAGTSWTVANPRSATGGARDLVVFDDAARAVARIAEIYEGSAVALRSAFGAFRADDLGSAPDAPYPYVGLAVGLDDLAIDARLAFGVVLDPGIYGTTLTRPDLFGDYYREQLGLLMERHRVPVVVGRGPRSIPLPFVAEHDHAASAEAGACARCTTQLRAARPRRHRRCASPTAPGAPARGEPRAAGAVHRRARRLLAAAAAPLHRHDARALPALRAVHQLPALRRRVRALVARHGRSRKGDDYDRFVEPGNVIDAATARRATETDRGTPPAHLPQMPAYHLTRPDRQRRHHGQHRRRPVQRQDDHRPHRRAAAACWLMLGHCAGLRTQPAARRLRARPRLCARGPRARRGPAALGAGAAARRGAGGAAGGGRAT